MAETMWINIIGYTVTALATIYVVLAITYLRGWIYTGVTEHTDTPNIKATVIIAARNEQDNIENLLRCLAAQQYPEGLLQVILVDDHSEDHTLKRARKAHFPGLEILRLPEGQQGKKAALEYGIQQATGQWILTTDADCSVSPNWVAQTIGFGEENNLNAVLGMLAYKNDSGLLNHLQQLELAGLMSITAGSLKALFPHMAHGANFAFTKKLFEDINGYKGLHHSPSGDDVMLLIKASRQKKLKAKFMINRQTVVFTKAARNWDEFWQQRLRWAGKSGQMGDWRVSVIMLFIYLFNLSLVIITLVALFTFTPKALTFMAVGWGLKLFADLNLMAPPLFFIGRTAQLVWLPISQPVYTFFMTLAGPASLLKPVVWKGRRF